VQAEKQRRFVRLIAQGVSNAEACRIVGINRRTGTRWRYGRSVLNSGGEVLHYPPVTIEPEKPRSCRYLSEQERVMIADRLAAGNTVRAIAGELGRSPSTISRELRRNAGPDGRYRPHQAQRAARERSRRPRERLLVLDAVLGDTVRELLGRRWSPEQVGHELAVRFAGQRRRCLCTESIYQAIYDPVVDVTRPARRRRRRRRLRGEHRRGRLVAMRMIAERPVEVEDRVQAGHWEGDLIMGTGNRSAIGTLVERSTRYLILLHLHDGVSSAETVAEALGATLGSLPAALRRTLTWDQGKELAQHQQITATTGTSVFFCDPHSPWQRASNENMNGLLRDYFPKGIDLTAFTASALEQVEVEVNQRPRKTLGWTRPADLFSSALESCA
jgi:Transposase and inactivated derivatives, IS30 family